MGTKKEDVTRAFDASLLLAALRPEARERVKGALREHGWPSVDVSRVFADVGLAIVSDGNVTRNYTLNAAGVALLDTLRAELDAESLPQSPPVTDVVALIARLRDEAARKWPGLDVKMRDGHMIVVTCTPATANVFPLAAPGVAGVTVPHLLTSIRGAESCDEVIERAEALAQVMRCVRWLLAEGKARGGELWR